MTTDLLALFDEQLRWTIAIYLFRPLIPTVLIIGLVTSFHWSRLLREGTLIVVVTAFVVGRFFQEAFPSEPWIILGGLAYAFAIGWLLGYLPYWWQDLWTGKWSVSDN